MNLRRDCRLTPRNLLAAAPARLIEIAVCPLFDADQTAALHARRAPSILRRVFRSPTRRFRHPTGFVVVSVLVAMQSMLATHACAALRSDFANQAPMTAVAAGNATPGSAHCAGAPAQGGDPIGVCPVHCKGDPQAYSHVYSPAAPIAPQPPLTVRVVDPFVPPLTVKAEVSPISAAPPPLLLFSRLLI